MKNVVIVLVGILCWNTTSWAQREDILLPQERKAYAEKSIVELKNGVLVVRLKTNHRKITTLQETANNSKLKPKQRARHQRLLEGTIATRDKMNQSIINMFLDSFHFCPIYVMYDTSSKTLMGGTRSGIFLNKNLELDPSITLPTGKSVFMVNYMKKSANFPFDVLIMRRLKKRLEEPFPYFIPLRASWVNELNTPGAAKAVVKLDRKLHRYYKNVINKKENE
jgi:hypothetical protein